MSWTDRLRAFRARIASGFVLAVALIWGGYQYREHQIQRTMEDVRAISREIAALPSPEVLKDFEAINQFRQVSAVADDELLTALSR